MNTKYIGVFMDHASARLLEYATNKTQIKLIESKSSHPEKEKAVTKGEKATHHKKQQEELAYYKNIVAAIKNYSKVLLFGPTEAKTALYNFLASDPYFKKIKITMKTTDKMTDNQQHAFVNKFFTELL